jgi:hypothetical protein
LSFPPIGDGLTETGRNQFGEGAQAPWNAPALRDEHAQLVSSRDAVWRKKWTAQMVLSNDGWARYIRYDHSGRQPLLGRRMPDLDVKASHGPACVFTFLHSARPVLLNLADPGRFDIAPWRDRIQLVDASYEGSWELPAIGEVPTPGAILIRPDGYVAWVGERENIDLITALTTWFGSHRDCVWPMLL